MSATPAQMANDLAAQAKYWDGRDDDVSRACHQCARLIRAMLTGDPVEGRTYGGLHGRLLDLEITWRERSDTTIWNSLTRGRLTLEALRRESRP